MERIFTEASCYAIINAGGTADNNRFHSPTFKIIDDLLSNNNKKIIADEN